jgi:GT2 family glycosyltransferase
MPSEFQQFPVKPSGKHNVKIGIPVLNRGDLLANLIASIDLPAEVFIVVNRIGPLDRSVEQSVALLERKAPAHLRISVHWTEGNLGVSGSWNRIIDYFAGDCLITNSDICFAKGILEYAHEQIESRREIALQYLRSAACFYVAESFTNQLGWFDENFYPAYHEDQEMALRSRILKIRRCAFAGIGKDNIFHGGSQTLKNANDPQRQYIGAANRLHGQYLKERWGSIPKDGLALPEKQAPFDNMSLHPADWTLDLAFRKRIANLCRHFTGFECPILYHRLKGGLR